MLLIYEKNASPPTLYTDVYGRSAMPNCTLSFEMYIRGSVERLSTKNTNHALQYTDTIESIPKHLEMETNWLPPPATHHYVYTSSISYNLRVAVTDIDTHVTRRREKQVVKTGATETRRHLELITTHHNLRGRRQKCSHGNR